MSLYLVYLAILLVTTAEGVINTLLPPYLDRAHYSVEIIGVVTALFGLLQLASRLPAGAIYSGARAKRLLVAFLVLYILSTATFGLGTDAWLIVPLTLVHGFAFGAITTFMLPVAIQLQTRETSHGARMGWYTAAISAGYALGAFAGGSTVDRVGYAATFMALGLLPIFSIALVLALPPIVAAPAPASAQPKPKNNIGATPALGFGASVFASASPVLWFATLVGFYINFLDDGFGTFFPLLGLSIGLTLTMIGNLNGTKSAVGIIIRIFSGRFFRFVNYRWLNHVLVVGWSLVVFALPWVKDQWLFVVLFIFMGLARSLSRVTSATLVAEEKARDPHGIGVASGIYNMGLDVGALVAPLVAGFIARLTDIPTMMRIISMLMVVIYFGALLWLNRVSARPV